MGERRADAGETAAEPPDGPHGPEELSRDGAEALLNSLTERESALVRETGTEVLRDLDEDALVDLHLRVRRARDKQVKIYRRQAATLVPEIGARGAARPKNARNRGKAEVFEDALARVSKRLAAAARASAAALRAERLAEARRATAPPRPPRSPSVRQDPGGSQVLDRRPDDPGLRKRHASERAGVARQQARRDAR
ncbi:hypothetical protein [Pseudonocardia lacus]|jgi:hypothetical protein|uniref:hypothetical protein n=1 Tax=Pseudonocardia lacus TaxID=2835865 RepID=UPI001BDD4F1C|nr:hypothetical protein [Pseudonocardia lacus]